MNEREKYSSSGNSSGSSSSSVIIRISFIKRVEMDRNV